MPFASKPSCSECKATSSSIWRKNQDGEVVCNSCQLAKQGGREGSEEAPSKSRSSRDTGGGVTGSQYIGPIRKSARLKPSKYKYQPVVKPLAPKGRSRRVVFKKNVRQNMLKWTEHSSKQTCFQAEGVLHLTIFLWFLYLWYQLLYLYLQLIYSTEFCLHLHLPDFIPRDQRSTEYGLCLFAASQGPCLCGYSCHQRIFVSRCKYHDD